MIASGKSERQRFEKGILLEPDEYQSSRHPGDLGNLPRDYDNEDRLQASTETIMMQKYLREKLSLPH